MKEIEEYKNNVKAAIKKVRDAHYRFNEIFDENQEFEKTVVRPIKVGSLTSRSGWNKNCLPNCGMQYLR